MRIVKQYEVGEMMGECVFLGEAPRKTAYTRRAKFKCHCGTEFEGNLFVIKYGYIKSCGCILTGLRKLTPEQVRKIRDMIWVEDMILQDVADIYNVTASTIFNIKVGKTYKRVE